IVFDLLARAELEGMEDLMYWSVYAGARIVPARLLGNCKTSGKVRYQRRNNRQNPYQIVELDDNSDTSPKHSRQNHINHITHCRSSRPTKLSKSKKKKRKAEKALQKTALKRVKATKKRLSFIEDDDQTASDVIFRINETNGTLTSPARDPAFAPFDIDSSNNIDWVDSNYPKFKSNILSSPSAILPFGAYPSSVLTEKSGIIRDRPCLSFETPIKESPSMGSMSEDSTNSVN
ncbi:9371_t:CDS:2, partial [Acaulospora morrowiae]